MADLVSGREMHKEIAAELHRGAEAVETRLSRTYAKLGVHSRTALARQLLDL